MLIILKDKILNIRILEKNCKSALQKVCQNTLLEKINFEQYCTMELKHHCKLSGTLTHARARQ